MTVPGSGLVAGRDFDLAFAPERVSPGDPASARRDVPRLVGGLTPAPVIAVPTSVGYGASLEGVTALLGMLASCAAGLTVVGIDNGYGAACAVLRMLK